MANKNLNKAKETKNDEFCTQFGDIQKEIGAYLEYSPDVFRGKVEYIATATIRLKAIFFAISCSISINLV